MNDTLIRLEPGRLRAWDFADDLLGRGRATVRRSVEQTAPLPRRSDLLSRRPANLG